MTPIAFPPFMFAGIILLALPACAATSPDQSAAATTSTMALDLGPSTRIRTTRVAMIGAGRESSHLVPRAESTGNAQPVRAGGDDAQATGTVNSVDVARRTINLSHNAIPSIGWPAMTMDFAVAPSVDLSRIKPGTKVDFSIQKSKSGMYEVQSLQPVGTGK